MARLTTLVLRHRRIVMVAWLVILVAGGMGAGRLTSRLSYDFSLPGQPGYETALKVLHIYGNGADNPPSLLVVSVPSGQSVSGNASTIAAGFSAVRTAIPSARIVDYGDTRDPVFVTTNGETTFGMLFSPPPKGFSGSKIGPDAQSILSKSLPPGYRVSLTGLSELENSSGGGGTGVLLETIIGGVGALAVLAFVFASFLAFVPLVVAAVSIPSTLLIVLGLSYVTQVSFVVQFLVALVGLGVAIDYSLLIVTRWREERHQGKDNETAVKNAMATAGRAVVFSGITVGIGLIAMIVLPVPSLRSVGYGGILIPLVSVAVASTLLPAILGGIGKRVDWPRIRHEDRASRSWTAWAQGVNRHRWAATGVAVAILGILIIPLFGLNVGSTGVNALAKTGTARVAYEELVNGGVPGGVLTPIEALSTSQAASGIASQLRQVPGVTAAVIPSANDSNHAGTSDVIAIPRTETLNSSSLATVAASKSAVAGMPGLVGLTGFGAVELDYSHAVFGHFPELVAVIAILSFLLLARAFRSIVLPLKAVVLNLVSVSATFGLVTWFWQDGHGSNAVFGIPATGAITFWVPLMIFAFLFGLSMDYEVFILSRMREEFDRTGSTTQAVVTGLGRTGRLVTSAALILFLAFATLASAPFVDLKVFATALGAGILLDATVVRALLLPALVSIFGRWNWWMPDWAAKVLFLPRQNEGTTGPLSKPPGDGPRQLETTQVGH